MQSSSDVLLILGNGIFDGGMELGSMSAGTVSILGNLSQFATNSPDSYHPSGTHVTHLAAASPTVTFATPGNVPGSSHFQELTWTGGGTLTLGSDVFAHGTFSGFTGSISSTGKTLSVGALSWGGTLPITNTQVVIDQPSGAPIDLADIVFQGMSPSATQLTVNHPGVGSPVSFTNLTFNTTPTTGFYLRANDTDGPSPFPLTIDMNNPTPATPGAFLQVTNGAVVNWPGVIPAPTWTGSVNTDWSNPGNWSSGTVPTVSDSVVIPAAANQPTLTAPVSVKAVNITGGQLTLGGQTMTVAQTFTTTGTGTLAMTSSSDTLTVQSIAIFSGADESGLLTAGVLLVQGSFVQLPTTSANSYVAGGTHKTSFTRDGSITFASSTSHFQDLELSGAITVQLGSDVGVTGRFTAFQSTTNLKGNGFKVIATAVGIQALSVDNTTIVVDEKGTGQAQQFDNVTFQGFPTTGATMLSFTGVGGAATPRNLTFTNVTFQLLPVGAGNLYVTLISSNGFGLNLTMQGSNQGRQGGGNGLTLSNPPNETTVGGATIFWP
jgi:hypothetical protein